MKNGDIGQNRPKAAFKENRIIRYKTNNGNPM
jgi:hypothetical protein